MKKIALALLFALAMLPAASFAQVVSRVGPPARVHEHRGPRPERGYVWISGYHRYEGDHYVWTPAVGIVHPMNTRFGLRTGGSTIATIGSCGKDIGGKPQGE